MGPNKTTSNTILIIDDDHDIRVAIRDALETEGYFVFSAANGVSGIETLQRIKPPGVILLDLMMPLMNGQEFLKEKNNDPVLSTIPVVIMSAFPDGARLITADGFLKKPIDANDLLKMVSRYCNVDELNRPRAKSLRR